MCWTFQIQKAPKDEEKRSRMASHYSKKQLLRSKASGLQRPSVHRRAKRKCVDRLQSQSFFFLLFFCLRFSQKFRLTLHFENTLQHPLSCNSSIFSHETSMGKKWRLLPWPPHMQSKLKSCFIESHERRLCHLHLMNELQWTHLPKWPCGDLCKLCTRRGTDTWTSGTARWQWQILCKGRVMANYLMGVRYWCPWKACARQHSLNSHV